jgi:hypothetical protein
MIKKTRDTGKEEERKTKKIGEEGEKRKGRRGIDTNKRMRGLKEKGDEKEI